MTNVEILQKLFKLLIRISLSMTISTKTTKKMSNLDMPANNKSDELVDVWIRPLKKYNLKIWIHKSNDKYKNPTLGIGLGTKIKPNIFSFVIMDDNSTNWFEKTLAKSPKILKKYNKNNTENNDDKAILWLKKREIDKIRKINISLFVIKNNNEASIRLSINSKASLYEELNSDDIKWIFETLNIAKYTLDEVLQYE